MVKTSMKQFNMNSIPRFLHMHLCSQTTHNVKSRIISLFSSYFSSINMNDHEHWYHFFNDVFGGLGFTTKPWLSWNLLSRLGWPPTWNNLPALPPKCWDNSVALYLAYSPSLKERTLSRDNNVTHSRQWYTVWFTDYSKVSRGWGRNILWAKNWPVYATQQGPPKIPTTSMNAQILIHRGYN